MMLRALSLLFILTAALLPSAEARAQISATSFGTSMTLSASPEYPAPYTAVKVSVNSVFLDLETSIVTWYVNDKLVQSEIGATTFTLETGGLGSEVRIHVEAQGTNASASAEGVIRPTEVDLLWEGDSYVPPFYRGRAYPTSGSNIRLFAIPRLVPPGSSSPVSPSELIYTWRQDGRILQGVGGRGKQSVTVDASPFSESQTISVEVKTADGNLRGFASERVPALEPELVLYEDHPAYGVLFHRALRNGSAIDESEASFTAVPYFAPAQSANDSLLEYAWRVNGSLVTNDSAHPHTITLNAEGTDGSALIELALTHATNYFLSARNSWALTLSALGTSVFTDPFRGTTQ